MDVMSNSQVLVGEQAPVMEELVVSSEQGQEQAVATDEVVEEEEIEEELIIEDFTIDGICGVY